MARPNPGDLDPARDEIHAVLERYTVLRTNPSRTSRRSSDASHPAGHYDAVAIGPYEIMVDSLCGGDAASVVCGARDALGGRSSELFNDPLLRARLDAFGWCVCGWDPPPSMRILAVHRRSPAA